MKKQILTMTMCLALTATSALAAGTATVSKTLPAKPEAVKSAVTKTVTKSATTKVTLKAAPAACATQSPEATLTPEQSAKKRFEERMAKERTRLYCDLKLTQDQIKKAEDLDVKSRAEGEPLMKKVHAEKIKLKDLTLKQACAADIKKQEKALKAAKKAAKAHFEATRKEFKAILTSEQKKQFEAMEKARKAERKEHKGCPCHGKDFKGPQGPDGLSPKGQHGPEFDGPEGPGVPPVGPPPPAGSAPKCPCKK